MSPVVDGTSDNNCQVAGISPFRPPKENRLKLELRRIDSTRLIPASKPASDVAEPTIFRKRIPTTKWGSRDTKDEVEKAVRKKTRI